MFYVVGANITYRNSLKNKYAFGTDGSDTVPHKVAYKKENE